MTRESENGGEARPRSVGREYLESFCVAIIIALFIRTFVVQAFKIPTPSMEPSLLVGDHLLVNKMVYAPTIFSFEKRLTPTRAIHRNDVIVFKFPREPERDFIKRVVGLPGERIRIENKTVYINGEPLNELPRDADGVPDKPESGVFFDIRRDNMPEMTIPEGQYFVMGDNRDNSRDSRFWGTLPKGLVKGRALVVYWSYDVPPEAYLATGWKEEAKTLLRLFTHFFTGTRWKRVFLLIR